ncbi:DNA-binding response regulator [Bacillus subtilis subsp. subtilis]|nr:DNA-binding response regulator [Bacillus subtilis subsp. subtilis]
MAYRILVVEDDEDIGDLLEESLTRAGYEVLRAKDGKRALQLVNDSLDLVILDIMMPGISGIETCQHIRKSSNVPILFLTARSSTLDKTEGLLAGGDDYMTKPFSEEELHARVIAQLRRYTIYQEKKEQEETFLIGGKLRVSEEFNEVWKEEKQIKLSDLEYRILKLLMNKRNKIFSAQNIYESVWGQPYFYCSNNTVMVHIRKLRSKIEDDPARPVYIKTEWESVSIWRILNLR